MTTETYYESLTAEALGEVLRNAYRARIIRQRGLSLSDLTPIEQNIVRREAQRLATVATMPAAAETEPADETEATPGEPAVTGIFRHVGNGVWVVEMPAEVEPNSIVVVRKRNGETVEVEIGAKLVYSDAPSTARYALRHQRPMTVAEMIRDDRVIRDHTGAQVR